MRTHSTISLERLHGVSIEREMEIGPFALVDKEEVLAKAKRDPSSSWA
jgi:hypothetical protein